MVKLGFVPQERTIPRPDMSFVRLFNDTTVGWQMRGQYAIWNGADDGDRNRYQLLRRVGNRVAPIRYDDGRHVLHQINAGSAFLVTNMAGCWLTFDTDAMWLDVPQGEGQYAVLAVGGAAGKPGSVDVDWACPRCGDAFSKRTFHIAPLAFNRFLNEVDRYAAEFNENVALRTCGSCGAEHPPAPGIIREDATPHAQEVAKA